MCGDIAGKRSGYVVTGGMRHLLMKWSFGVYDWYLVTMYICRSIAGMVQFTCYG